MKCKEIKPLLTLFLDNQLPGKEAQEVKAHLDACSLCSKELKLLKESWNLLDEWEPVVPSPNFKAAFWQRVSQEETTVTERGRIFVFPRLKVRPAPAFAAIAAIIIMGIFLTNLASVNNLQQLTLLTKDEDALMLKELDLTEDLEIIQNITTLEDWEAIDSIQS